MEGAFPEAADEVAIDRMYADNNSLSRWGMRMESTDGGQLGGDWPGGACRITAVCSADQ